MLTDTYKTGIYEIRNVVSGKVYIGSAKKFNFRWNSHKNLLRKGCHHSSHLQAAWSKYGEQAFQFKKLLVCSEENLIMYEQIMIDAHKAANRKHGYNARPIAESMLGYKHSAETKAKIVISVTGRKASPETRALLSKQRTGRKMPNWFPEFTRLHRTGSKHSDATKAVISEKGTGRPCSLDTREKKAKLTFEQVQYIKSKVEAGVPQAQLATEFSLHQSSISLIASGKRWANLPSSI